MWTADEHVSTYQNKTEVNYETKTLCNREQEYDHSTSSSDERAGLYKSQAVDFIAEYYSKMQNDFRVR